MPNGASGWSTGVAVCLIPVIVGSAVSLCPASEDMLVSVQTQSALSLYHDGDQLTVSLRTEDEVDHELARKISDWGPLYIGGVTISMMASPETEQRRRGERVADALLVTAAANSLVKHLTHLPRPRSDNPRLVRLGLAPPSNGRGFPSGHSSEAFAFATVMADQDREDGWWWYGMAAAIGWSRVEALGTCIARCSLRSHDGLLNGVAIRPRRVELGDATLTLGFTFTPGRVELVSLEF